MPAEILAQVAGSYELPGEAVFPESIGVDAATGGAYVGSLALGTLYRLASAGTAELWAAGGQHGRGSGAGVKVDTRGRLWAAGGHDGTLWVYDLASRGLLARLATGVRPSLVNDIHHRPPPAARGGADLLATDSPRGHAWAAHPDRPGRHHRRP